jgi:membrane-bound serine protease (ClpP class)
VSLALALWPAGFGLAAEQAGPATSPPVSVPAARAAKNVVVITIKGPIDRWTAREVERRLAEAAKNKADAVVFELDTPGGALDACLAICGMIRQSPITNTVAWVNPNAYSAGAVIALACREIIVSGNATMGDALPIAADPIFGVQQMSDAEREKFLGPLMAEVVDSARRNGHDEMLVQGVVRRGVALWLVEHQTTGERLFVTADQYRLAVGSEPPRTGTPAIASATAPLDSKTTSPGDSAPKPELAASPAQTPTQTPAQPAAPGPDSESGVAPGAEYVPAAPGTSPELVRDVNSELALRGTASKRPDLGVPDHAGKYRLVEYVADGYGLVVLKPEQMLRWRVAAGKVDTDKELKAFFGASNVVRLDEGFAGTIARFLSQLWVRGVLIVVFLIALFIEMTHPGVVIPGLVAGVALLALVIPPVLIDIGAWWTAAAILLGIALIAVEVFLLPGLAVFGVAGVLLLFGGLVGVFVGGPGGLFPDSPQGRSDLAFAVTTILISFATAGVGSYVIGRHLHRLPVFGRLVLTDPPKSTGSLFQAMSTTRTLKVGDAGLALTPLRPAGRVQFGEEIVDVVADTGFIPTGTSVRVVSVDDFRVSVEPIPSESIPAPPGTPRVPPGFGAGGHA